MSRLYLIVLFIGLFFSGNAQKDLSNYLKFAKEQYQKGDYIYALQYYEKAMQLDSTTIEILWEYAETNRAYKDYRKAEYYYKKVYSREDTKIFPASLLQLGLMQKQNGKYDEAIETFKLAKKKYTKDKKGYLYQKSKREFESCLWAKSAIKDTTAYILQQLPATVNTPNSEFGHTIYDGKLIFSSLRGDSVHANEEVYSTEYKTRLYTSVLQNQDFKESEKIKDLVVDKMNSGNGAFSKDGSRFYFSLCQDDGYNYKCKIMVSNYLNGKWKNIDTLGDIINQAGANTSMPAMAFIDNQEVLFFSSDRDGGKGGMDIYYSFIKNGQQFGKVQALKPANSLDNEISPFWDDKTQRLYFSSSWHDGFGGLDIFYSELLNGSFTNPINIGIPNNSPANDTYFFVYNDTNYVSSNRLGVIYSKNPTCCSDIFSLHVPIRETPFSPRETLVELNKRLPVTLYFHNDWPDPKTTSTTTKINYIDNFNDYMALIPEYKKEYSSGLSGNKSADAQEDIESFFTEYVAQGVKDLEHFRDLILEELEKGTSLELTIKGFASPLAKTDYNVNLTKRRIASLVNYLENFNNGVFKTYLNGNSSNGAKITIREIPFGEYTSNKLISDNPNDQKNSVYSRAASMERKIEIQSISIVSKDSLNIITSDVLIQDFGKIVSNVEVSSVFKITNTSDEEVNFQTPEIPCACNRVEFSKMTLKPGESLDLKIYYRPKNEKGSIVKFIYLKTIESNKVLKLAISAEVL
jgi:tetratricopeptide (TPR) repeat protein